PIVQLIIAQDGCIFGGFLRDFIANEPPNDMDICLFDDKYESVSKILSEMGYTETTTQISNKAGYIVFTEDVYHWSKPNSIPLEIVLEESKDVEECTNAYG